MAEDQSERTAPDDSFSGKLSSGRHVIVFIYRLLHVHAEAVDEVPIGQRAVIQHADIFRITLNAIPDIDIGLGFAHDLVGRVFALVDGAIAVVLLLHSAELLLMASAADVMPLLELLKLVILELLEQVSFSPTQSLLAGCIPPDDVESLGINSPLIHRLLTHGSFCDP